jgi:hypothetical protein
LGNDFIWYRWFLIGFPIETAIGGRDPKWALAGAGAVLVLATIPIL